MLERKNGSGYEYRHLFAIVHGLKWGTDGHFGLSEAYIPTSEPVHGPLAFHVLFDILGGSTLVRGVLIDKGGFQFVLQIAVRTILEPLFRSAFCVQLDQVEGYFLYPRFGLVLDLFPGSRSQFVYFWLGTVLAVEFGDFMQGVDAYVKNIAISVHQLYGLLFLALHIYFLEAPKLSDPVVYMGHVIPDFQFVKVF